MTSAPSNLFSAILLQIGDRTLVEAEDVAPPDKDSLSIAAAVRARCPVRGGGSVIVVSPESSFPVFRTVARLGRSLEKLTGESVLTIGFGFSAADKTSGDRTATDFRSTARGPSAERSPPSPTETEQAIVARMNVGGADLLAAEASGELSRFLLELKTKFRFVLIAGESLRTSPETVMLGQASDGLVLTVEQGVTSLAAVCEAQHTARLAGLRLLGFVLEKHQRKSAKRRE